MPGWNFADVWEVIAEELPDAPALAHGDRRITWSEFDQRADGVARALLDAGAAEQDKVAHYLYNGPEYLESLFAMYKAGLVPVNTNYRYADDELLYLWDNADAVAVIFHGAFAERIETLRARLPRIRTWMWVDDGSGPCPTWATPYEQAATSKPGRVVAPWGRDGDQLYILYTGGTTGMPKGVMWRQDDVFMLMNSGNGSPYPEEPDLDLARKIIGERGPGMVGLPACPLMHGTAAFVTYGLLITAGSVVTLPSRNFDVEELLGTIEGEGVNSLVIVGDAFAKPMLRALDASSDRWDISSLRMIISSGVMWSEETKQGLLGHHSGMLLVDSLGSSEAVGLGMSVSSAAGSARTAKFSPGENTRVIADDGRFVEPGSGQIGMIAIRGRVPVGYYKDEEKSAHTFRQGPDGARYSIPGDYATVEADGSLTLLGRGSVCINTGGEKVFPEEVEEVLKLHPAVRDAVAVGVPDDRFGEAICAMVEPESDADIEEADVIAHVKAKLAGFKAPKRVLTVGTIGRAANGKVDYKRLKAEAVERIGSG